MGIGDDIIATSLAKGAAARGKRIAFGNGTVQKWGPYSDMVFRNNPNICQRGQEHASDVEWSPYCKGNRIYNRQSTGRWVWNYGFKVTPGELFFSADEDVHDRDDKLILIEPNVPNKPCGPNKQWPLDRWQALARVLIGDGWKVRQFEYGKPNYAAPRTSTATFRHAAVYLKSARLAILPEGGLHHAAAAVGCPAVVLFGGFVPPAVLGYAHHTNLTGGAEEACGSFNRCSHCVEAMDRITVEHVLIAARRYIG